MVVVLQPQLWKGWWWWWWWCSRTIAVLHFRGTVCAADSQARRPESPANWLATSGMHSSRMHARVSQCMHTVSMHQSVEASKTEPALLQLLSRFQEVVWMQQVLHLRLSSGSLFKAPPLRFNHARPSNNHVLQLWILPIPAAITPSACLHDGSCEGRMCSVASPKLGVCRLTVV